ncbi:uncharacterized protein LOC144036522 [Vanacampus margaritifer]
MGSDSHPQGAASTARRLPRFRCRPLRRAAQLHRHRHPLHGKSQLGCTAGFWRVHGRDHRAGRRARKWQNSGMYRMSQVAIALRTLAKDFNIAALVTNYVTRSEDGELQPGLGVCWSHVPKTRVLLEQLPDTATVGGSALWSAALLKSSRRQAPVWEITGVEFSKSEMHTADGISIRFPRMTRVPDDKDWKSATNLPQLKELYRISKENCDFKVTAGPSGQDKGESGGDSGGNSPAPESPSPRRQVTAHRPNARQ